MCQNGYTIFICLALLSMVLPPSLSAQQAAGSTRHVKVYYEPGMFGGWPANFGIWSWDNEILVGFAKGYYKDLGPERHNIDREKPELHLLARSLDGGETWKTEDPCSSGRGSLFVPNNGSYHGTERTDAQHEIVRSCTGINFLHPDLAMTFRMTNVNGGESYYWYSYDRGHAWEGPFLLPAFNGNGTAARTDYLVEGKDACRLFLSAPKTDGREGRPLCVRTTDGGKSWSFVSWIGPEPTEGYAIMPASVRLSDREILVAVRRNKSIGAYFSGDNGQTWEERASPVLNTGEGNPPAMIRLKDGRICLAYGSRMKPYSICAKLSSDKGKTWSNAIMLRSDGSGRDMGYPRMIQRPDGRIAVVYYFQDAATGPERYIGCTIWDPPALTD